MNIVSVQSGQWEMDKANNVAAAMLNEHAGPQGDALRERQHGAGRGGRHSGGRQDRAGAGRRLRQHQRHAADCCEKGQVVATADQHGDQLAVFGIEAALKILKGEAPPADQTTPVDLVTRVTTDAWPTDPLLQRHRPAEELQRAGADGLQLRAAAGEVHALVGSNGAGKSTFARILSGLTSRDSGDDAARRPSLSPRAPSARPSTRRHHGAPGAQCHRHAERRREHLPEPAAAPRRVRPLRRPARTPRAQALARVGLGDIDPATPGRQLGVGQQQLVEIAGALVAALPAADPG